MAIGNGNARHADAVTAHLVDETERHERAAAKRQREFDELLVDVDDDEEDSTVIAAAVGAGVRAALESQHDHDPLSDSTPPDMPWHVRVLPRPLRWIVALVLVAVAVVSLLQALAALKRPTVLPAHQEPVRDPP